MKRRRLIWLLSIAAVAAALGATTVLRYQGILLPVRVASGSMADSLLGPHRSLECKDCGFTFCFGLDLEVPLDLATCPNCGYARNDSTRATLHEGDRVLIDRWAYAFSAPARGDVVAFCDPTNNSELAVKRIMGLPSERIEIAHGEIFTNGTLYRKRLVEAMQVATLVYDDANRPHQEGKLAARWASDEQETGWRALNGGYAWTPPSPDNTRLDWLTYRHWRCYTSPTPRMEETPIADNDAYNQGLSRELHEVTDLILSCKVTTPSESEITLMLHDGRESFTAMISTITQSVELRRGERFLTRAALAELREPRARSTQFGIVDQQLLIAVEGKPLIRCEYTPLDKPLQPTSRPIGIAARGGECAVTEIRVYRDIYYLNAFGGSTTWSCSAPIPAETYLVLGDNSPISRDSRHWNSPGLHRNLFVGKVLGLRR
ncbi:MAG: signal peptidase I [Planctomycetaceae bacterium]|nr:signal peptidase I [Planctomycetales bacterium]MCB9927506.1 signal peptidase I [Planctomycetaceae bacterium]